MALNMLLYELLTEYHRHWFNGHFPGQPR